MKTYKNLYSQIYGWKNLYEAYLEARNGKTKKAYVKDFEANLRENLYLLHKELKEQTYKPKDLVT